jgi:short-subunit dehydrogenase
LITGGSSGIGFELARRFARDGSHLVLVARDAGRLSEAAGSLAGAGGAPTCIASDLSEESAPSAVARELRERGLAVDVLVNNAGYGMHGAFASAEPEALLSMIRVNVLALTALTRMLLPPMVERGSGHVLNIASTAAFFPGPFMAVYYATKAYVRSFSEGLSAELRGTGVRVTALCPPATATGFAARAGAERSPLFTGRVMDAATVADAGYRALRSNRMVVVPGLNARLLTFSTRLMPRGVLANVVRGLNGEG